MSINEIYDYLSELVEKDQNKVIIPSNICSAINSYSFSGKDNATVQDNYEFIYALILRHEELKTGSLNDNLPPGCKNPHTKQFKNSTGILCEFLDFDLKLQLIIQKFIEKPNDLFEKFF